MLAPTKYQLDALKEIVNTGVGMAAASLNEMLDAHIELDVPAIGMHRLEELEAGPDGLGNTGLACVKLGFNGLITGTAALVFPPQSAAKLVAALTGEDLQSHALNAVMAGTLNEVGNILINSVIGTIGNILAKPFDFSLPTYLEGRMDELLKLPQPAAELMVLVVRTQFRVRDRQVEGNIFIIFELGSFDILLGLIDDIYREGPSRSVDV